MSWHYDEWGVEILSSTGRIVIQTRADDAAKNAILLVLLLLQQDYNYYLNMLCCCCIYITTSKKKIPFLKCQHRWRQSEQFVLVYLSLNKKKKKEKKKRIYIVEKKTRDRRVGRSVFCWPTGSLQKVVQQYTRIRSI